MQISDYKLICNLQFVNLQLTIMSDLLQKLEAINVRFIEVGKQIVDPDIIADMKRYVKLNKEYKDLE